MFGELDSLLKMFEVCEPSGYNCEPMSFLGLKCFSLSTQLLLINY